MVNPVLAASHGPSLSADTATIPQAIVTFTDTLSLDLSADRKCGQTPAGDRDGVWPTNWPVRPRRLQAGSIMP